MSAWQNMFRTCLCLLLLIAALAGCGQGGTEIGNPNQPAPGNAPTSEADGQDAAPSFEEPTPTPDSETFLVQDPEAKAQEL